MGRSLGGFGGAARGALIAINTASPAGAGVSCRNEAQPAAGGSAPCAPRLGLLRGECSAFASSLRSAGDTERGKFVLPESAQRLSGTHPAEIHPCCWVPDICCRKFRDDKVETWRAWRVTLRQPALRGWRGASNAGAAGPRGRPGRRTVRRQRRARRAAQPVAPAVQSASIAP